MYKNSVPDNVYKISMLLRHYKETKEVGGSPSIDTNLL